MNKTDSLFIMGMIDEKYIAEADNDDQKMPLSKWVRYSSAAACLIIVIGCAAAAAFVLKNDSPSTVTSTAGITKEAPTIEDYIIKDGVLISYVGNITDLVIPEEVHKISTDAFSNAPSANKIETITAKSVYIECGALAPLKSLQRIIIESDQDNLSGLISSALMMSTEEIISSGIGLEYVEDDMCRIYGYNGIILQFEDKANNPLTSSSVPTKMMICDPKITMPCGIHAGMTPSEAQTFKYKWDEIYADASNHKYITALYADGCKYTLEWDITESDYESWMRSLAESGCSDEAYILPYLNGTLGTVSRIISERIFEVSRCVNNFNWNDEITIEPLPLIFSVPGGWKAGMDNSTSFVYLRYDERLDNNVPALEIKASFYVDDSFVLDESICDKARPKIADPLIGRNASVGVTEHGYDYVIYDRYTDFGNPNGEFYNYEALVYLRITDNVIISLDFRVNANDASDVGYVINTLRLND